MDKDIKQALEILRNGGLILYPTDTIWGIGCDATNASAVKRIYELKKREETKSMLVLVDVPGRIERYVQHVPEIAWQLIEVNDKPMTVIYPGAKNIAANLVSADGTIGIRVANDEFCQKLITRFNKPIVSTSANVSGEPSPAIFDEISDDIKKGVDFIVTWRQNDLSKSPPSQIIKIGSNGEIEIIRK